MTEAELLSLFDRYHNMVYRLALAVTRSPQDAEDVVQTVFLKLLDGKAPPADGSERAWLTRVAVNASRDLLRSFWRRNTGPLDESIPFVDPEEGALLAAVMTLPARLRVVLHLHYYEGYTCAEIADLLRISPSAVSMRLHRARKLLKSKLREDDHESLVQESL